MLKQGQKNAEENQRRAFFTLAIQARAASAASTIPLLAVEAIVVSGPASMSEIETKSKSAVAIRIDHSATRYTPRIMTRIPENFSKLIVSFRKIAEAMVTVT